MSTIEMIEDTEADALSVSLKDVNTAIGEFDKIAAGFAALEKAHPVDLAIDVTTTKGMKEAIAGRAAWRDPRIATEKARKAAKAPVLTLGKEIDARAAAITDRLLIGEANYDDQIRVEEKRKAAEAEEKRLAEITRRERNSATLAAIRQRAFDVQGKPAAVISGAIVALHTDESAGFGVDADYAALLKIAIEDTREKLREMHQAAIEREAEDAQRKAEAEALAKERAELAKLRAEQDARDAAARAELAAQQRAADEARAKADAEARALRDAEESRLRAERAEQQAKIDAERAELRKAQDEADRAARVARDQEETRQREIRAAAALAQEQKEAIARAERIAAQEAEATARALAAQMAREKADAEHAADAKGRNAWRSLAAVCEAVLIPGAKLSDLRLSARAALDEAQ